MAWVDRLTREWWRRTGRRVDVAGEDRWLDAPTSAGSSVADGWLGETAARLGGQAREDVPTAGLMRSMASLDGRGFDAGDLHPAVRDFYEHTSRWRMEVWAGWNPLFWPAGAVVSRYFGRRVDQLALPVRALDAAHGIDSRIVVLTDEAGVQVAAGWLRTLRRSGDYVYSGCYDVRSLPGADRPSVHVSFPLEDGNVQVFLRPEVGADGSLVLTSSGERFGSDGAYVVVRVRGRHFAALVPLHERIHVYIDDEGTLRTDHELRLWRAPLVRLHYRLEPRRNSTTTPDPAAPVRHQ